MNKTIWASIVNMFVTQHLIMTKEHVGYSMMIPSPWQGQRLFARHVEINSYVDEKGAFNFTKKSLMRFFIG